jgi:hypothetical protein
MDPGDLRRTAARTAAGEGRTARRRAARSSGHPCRGSMPPMSPTDITIIHAAAVHTVRVKRGRR